MPGSDSWEFSEPTTLDLDGPMEQLHLRLYDGALNVVRMTEPDGPVRVEISELRGAPVQVRREGASLLIGYEDMTWERFLGITGRKFRRRRAVVSVSVPEGVRVTAGVVSATTVVSGISGGTEIRGATGGITLVGLGGPVEIHTASGDVEGQSITGPLRFHSASGDMTLLDGAPEVEAETVSGRLMLDLAPGTNAPRLRLNSVSGAVAVRFPEHSGATVRASSVTGGISSEFPGFSSRGSYGPRKVSGPLGDGRGRVDITTVSGSIALLRRPADNPADASATSPLVKDI
jgi:hypothetical protein